jgi:DNA-binding LacI/PurR family transcriptional regulator
MADVAARVGISRAAVSIALRGAEGTSEATRQRVLQAAADLGYRPDSLAAGLRRNRSTTLGVLFALRRPFEVELVEHMYPIARQLGHDLLLSPFLPGRTQDAAVDELLRYRCAGLIVVGPELHARDLEPLAKEVAVVEVGRGVTRGPVDVIRNDDAVGTRAAVDHLVQLGHRHIAYVDGGENPGAEDRRTGYRAAMQDHGLARHARIVPGGYTEDDGAAAARDLITGDRPTAVIAANDLCAIGILDTALRSGLTIPHDLSVIGYDDSRFGRLPGIDLTSVRQDIPRMARQAVKSVVDRLDKPAANPATWPSNPPSPSAAPPHRRRTAGRGSKATARVMVRDRHPAGVFGVGAGTHAIALTERGREMEG